MNFLPYIETFLKKFEHLEDFGNLENLENLEN